MWCTIWRIAVAQLKILVYQSYTCQIDYVYTIFKLDISLHVNFRYRSLLLIYPSDWLCYTLIIDRSRRQISSSIFSAQHWLLDISLYISLCYRSLIELDYMQVNLIIGIIFVVIYLCISILSCTPELTHKKKNQDSIFKKVLSWISSRYFQ